MATSTQEPQGALLHYPRLGQDGEACAACGTPLDADQRYCLECGARRGDARLPFERYLGSTPDSAAASAQAPPPATPPAASTRQNDPSPLGAMIGVALLGGMLLIGVLLGRGGDDGQSATPVVQVGQATTADTSGSGSGSAATVSDTKVTSEWPDGKNGWTIELGTLPKQGTTAADVDSTKKDLESKGAKDLGVLDSDLYASLPAGNYIVYSGVFDAKADADKALKGLGGDFADAQVVEVSDQKPSGGSGGDLLSSSNGGGGGGGGGKPGDTVEASTADLEQLQNTTGDDYQDQINNIPDTVATPGQAPPDDPTVKPGGDSAGDEIVIGGN
jgi:hypothetical protein